LLFEQRIVVVDNLDGVVPGSEVDALNSFGERPDMQTGRGTGSKHPIERIAGLV